MTIAYWIIAVLLGVISAFGGVKKLVQSRDQLRPKMGWVDSCKHLVQAGDLVGVIRQVVVDWLVAKRTSAFRRLPGNKRCRVRAEDVLSLAEERDHR